jgi:hypothetical protein
MGNHEERDGNGQSEGSTPPIEPQPPHASVQNTVFYWDYGDRFKPSTL